MDTILTYGAVGECVSKLTALARAAGVDVAQTDKLDAQTLDTIVTNLGLGEQVEGITTPDQPYKGRLVDSTVWQELRERAAAYTGLTISVPAAATDSQPVPPAGAESTAAGDQPAPIGAAQPGAGVQGS